MNEAPCGNARPDDPDGHAPDNTGHGPECPTVPEGALDETLPENALSATLPEEALSATCPEDALPATLPEGALSATRPEAGEAGGRGFTMEDAKSLWGGKIQPGKDDAGLTIKAGIDSDGDDASSRTRTLRRTRVTDVGDGASGAAFPGTTESDFYTRKVLGKGGMGTVFLATQRSLGREVALKVIRGAKSGKLDTRNKFIAEAQVTGELDHPNIIPVYELAEAEDGSPFYSMKVVRGKPWSRELAAKSEEENVDILLRLSDAVGFAHDKGVIHRDLKPDNVMLGDYGEILLMDWGLAVSRDGRGKAERVSAKNACAGTPAYMAPEMAMGQPDAIGPETDIYLLGAILFEILTGQRPHEGATVLQCIAAAAANAIKPVDRDDDLIAVALKAMATLPSDRYRTVKEFQRAIRECLSHRESNALAAGAREALDQAVGCGDYERFAQAVFGLNEALRLWDGNDQARALRVRARREYGRCASSRGDYELALTQLQGVDDDETEELRRAVLARQAEATTRRRRLRTLTATAIGLTAALIVVLIAGTGIIYDRMGKEAKAREFAERQERVAHRALQETNEARERERAANDRNLALARERADALWREAEAQSVALAAAREREAALAREKEARDRALAAAEAREVALAREKEARDRALAAAEAREVALAREKEARDRALAAAEAREEALVREKEAQSQRLAAVEREAETERRRAAEEELRRRREEELTRLGYLEDDTWWTFDAARARTLQEQAATESAPAALAIPLADGMEIAMRLIPAGAFVMGSNPRDPLRQSDEYLHQVVLGKPFYLAATELTRAQWRALVGVERLEELSPGGGMRSSDRGPADTDLPAGAKAVLWRTLSIPDEERDLPASGISFRDVRDLLLPRLAAFAPEGYVFSLPSEAQWEYACRAGTSTRYCSGDSEEDLRRVGVFFDNSNLLPRAVAGMDANAWGLCDMHGNLSEMTRDVYSASYYLESPQEDPVNTAESIHRVIRGGSFIHAAAGCRSAKRGDVHVDNRYGEVGVRVALCAE